MLKVLITGVMGSGKSTAGLFLKNLSYPVFIADDYVDTLFLENSSCYQQLKELFPSCLQEDHKTFDKKKVAEIIFQERDKKSALEEIIHPLVWEAFDDFVKVFSPKNTIVFCEMPPIFKNRLSYFDECVLVLTPASLITKRLVSKGWKKQEIENRLKNQMEVEFLKKHCNFIIDNSEDLNSLHQQLQNVLDQLKKLSI